MALLAKCVQQKSDCNNYTVHGKCMALTGTVFSKPCPFYCSVADTRPSDRVYHVIDFKMRLDMRE